MRERWQYHFLDVNVLSQTQPQPFSGNFIFLCLYFKDKADSTTGSTKWSFNVTLGLLEVLVPNFILKHLGFQDIDMSVIIIYPFILSSYGHSIQFDREGLTNVHTYISVEFGKYIFIKKCRNKDQEVCELSYSLLYYISCSWEHGRKTHDSVLC